jgi:hypothetical protein
VLFAIASIFNFIEGSIPRGVISLAFIIKEAAGIKIFRTGRTIAHQSFP